MMTLELDDETAILLNQLVEQEHISPAQLITEMYCLTIWKIAKMPQQADEAYQRYLAKRQNMPAS